MENYGKIYRTYVWKKICSLKMVYFLGIEWKMNGIFSWMNGLLMENGMENEWNIDGACRKRDSDGKLMDHFCWKNMEEK